MSLRRRFKGRIWRTVWLAVVCSTAVYTAAAQYVGKVTENKKDSPELRSVAVLEYTGDEGNPKSSRLVPVAVLDAGALQDGSLYLARPEPLALVPEVEYELEEAGKPVGLFDIKNAGQQDGGWVGFGAWKPLPSAKAKPAPKVHLDDEDDGKSDEPVLHRKHQADNSSSGGGGGSASQSNSPSEPSDPDRPVLHKKPDSSGSGDSSANGNSTSGPEGGGPVLHSGSNDSAQASSDPDRPTMKRPQKAAPTPAESAEEASGQGDPDRPRLKRGKSTGDDIEVAPSLKGFPPDVQQVVAVSDAKNRPPHPWTYSWSNPDDEAKMKASLENIARTALGLNPPATKPAPRRTATAATATRRVKPVAPAAPAPLADEHFRVFELAYGSGATLVLSAHTDGPPEKQKFVTIVAQPDLYGNALVLLKNVTDGAHLDQEPRMRLVDAVDALADNRGELLFELRGATQRQFALYRVLRGQAEKLFVTNGGAESSD